VPLLPFFGLGIEADTVPFKSPRQAADAERKVPEDAIREHNETTAPPPPRFDASIPITGNYFALYKQYQKEIAMLKADERANERHRKKVAKPEET